MLLTALLMLGASLLALQLPAWPDPGVLLGLAALVLPGVWCLLGLRGCAVGLYLVLLLTAGRSALDARLPQYLIGQDVLVTGMICDFPRASSGVSRFVIEVTAPRYLTGVHGPLLVRWYDPPRAPRIGERWRLKIRLRPVRGSSNPGGFDLERWLLAQRIGATAYVRPSRLNQLLHGRGGACPTAAWRARAAARLDRALERHPGAAFVRGVSVGDRSGLTPAHWEVLRRTGTSHLMAISGLHVGLVAGGLGFAATLLVQAFVGRARRRFARGLVVGAALAGGAAYAALAGFSVPTQRALLMLAVGTVLLLRHRRPGLNGAFGGGVAGLLFGAPLAVLSPGLWLSIGGVATCLAARGWVAQDPSREKSCRQVFPWAWGARLLVLQVALLIALAPLTVVFFDQLSLVSVVANALAVPGYALGVVPAALLGVAAARAWPDLGSTMLTFAADLARLIAVLLTKLAAWPWAALDLPATPGLIIALAGVGAATLLWPRPLPGRSLAVLLWLPLLGGGTGPEAPAGLRVLVFDVGQGLAVLVQTRAHALLYDAGPVFRGGDAARSNVLPGLAALGVRRLDRVVISHSDADHRGGLATLIDAFPDALVMGPAGLPAGKHAVQACDRRQRWRWDDVEFAVLHPARVAGRRGRAGNNDSCVLNVRSGAAGLLLAGDIEWRAERELLAARMLAPVDLVIVPHHGSRSSSHAAFVAAIQPRFAVVSAALYNRWSFPAPEVEMRWVSAGACVLHTGRDGSLWFEAEFGGHLALVERRRARPAPWRVREVPLSTCGDSATRY